jgi:hypothetical protein
MTRRLVFAALALVVLVGGIALPREAKRAGVFAPLEAGQRVVLREKDYGYEIDVVPGAEEGHKVVEVGADSLVLEDPAGAVEVRIPIYAVKAIKVFRAPKEKVKGAAPSRRATDVPPTRCEPDAPARGTALDWLRS